MIMRFNTICNGVLKRQHYDFNFDKMSVGKQSSQKRGSNPV